MLHFLHLSSFLVIIHTLLFSLECKSMRTNLTELRIAVFHIFSSTATPPHPHSSLSYCILSSPSSPSRAILSICVLNQHFRAACRRPAEGQTMELIILPQILDYFNIPPYVALAHLYLAGIHFKVSSTLSTTIIFITDNTNIRVTFISSVNILLQLHMLHVSDMEQNYITQTFLY